MTRQELIANIQRKRSFLCVGLDSEYAKLPECVRAQFPGKPAEAVYAFNCAIIDATAPYCIAYKPNIAFYETLGAPGVEAFEKTVEYIRRNHPDQLIIADAKRGDIGNTARQYAQAFFDQMQVDALTVAPYMGKDSVTPFLGFPGKWAIVLALTSNPGSADFQLISDPDGTPLFEQVLAKTQTWTEIPDQELMFVVGATRGKMFEDVRRVAPRSFLLVPGVGAQGGSLEEVAQYGMIPGDCGLIVNSSRGVIFASKEADFAQAAGNAARALQQQMDALL